MKVHLRSPMDPARPIIDCSRWVLGGLALTDDPGEVTCGHCLNALTKRSGERTTNEVHLVALLDQMDATARDLTLVLEADQRATQLAQEYLDTVANPFLYRRRQRARERMRLAHELFMQHRYEEVLDL